MVDNMFLTKTEKTFQNQDSLPSLPIPTLQHTMERYLDSVKPLVTDEEYKETELIVSQFASGIGKELHFKLCERAKYMRNWLEKWWDEAVYLELRNSNALYGNMSGPGPYMDGIWPEKLGSQLERAAMLIYHQVLFWHILRTQTLTPHKDNQGRPLCMNQFTRMMNTCRIPGHQRDQLLYHFRTKDEGGCANNLIVLCKGRVFSIIPVDENEEPLTPLEIQKQLEMIETKCSNLPHGQGISNLTTLRRSDWAEVRGRILALHPDNFSKLKQIEESIAVMGLDDDCPQNVSEVSWKGLGGSAETKWFDKSLNMTVFKNGLVVSNCDHAPTDAMVLVACTLFIDTKINESKGVWQGSKIIRKGPTPVELILHLDSTVKQSIHDAKINFRKRCDEVEVLISQFTDYGKNAIRKYKLHPDTHVQLSIQLAYYRKHKKPAATYETATTRRFYHGRTETMRSCTKEAINWCKAMLDPTVGDGRKYQLYKIAADRHNFLMEEASSLNGCDRHLLGLAMICREENIPLPDIFKDSSFFKSGGGGNFVLSTSSLGYTIANGGVAPMCENGYGIFYKIENKQIVLFISSWTADKETSVVELEQEIHTSLREMYKLIQGQSMMQARL